MIWRRPGDDPLSESMIVSLLTHVCVTRSQCVACKNWFPQCSISTRTIMHTAMTIEKLNMSKHTIRWVQIAWPSIAFKCVNIPIIFQVYDITCSMNDALFSDFPFNVFLKQGYAKQDRCIRILGVTEITTNIAVSNSFKSNYFTIWIYLVIQNQLVCIDIKPVPW